MAADERGSDGSTRIIHQDLLLTGPGTLAGRYLRMFWQPIHLAADLKPGRAMPIKVMSEDFTLYRGERDEARDVSGEPHLVAFRCAHRGTQLSTGWVEGDDIRCFYHGWKYGPDGQCTEQPAEPEPFCERIRIKAYPTREYLGFIWAYMGEGQAPEFPRLPEFEHPEWVSTLSAMVWPCNYFTQLDNAVDPAHTVITHHQFGWKMGHLEAEEAEYGVAMYGSGFSAVDFPQYFHMPNAHEWGSPPRPGGKDRWSFARGWRVPIDDFHHLRLGIDVVPLSGAAAEAFRERQAARWARATRPPSEVAEEVLRGARSPSELDPELYPDLVNVQDYVALVGLGPIAAEPPAERLGRADLGLVLLRRIWARELAALAEGRPLKAWRRPDSLWGDFERSVAQEHAAG